MLESLLNKVAELHVETPTQVFSSAYCEIFENSFSIEHLRWLLLAVLLYYQAWRNYWSTNIYRSLISFAKSKRERARERKRSVTEPIGRQTHWIQEQIKPADWKKRELLSNATINLGWLTIKNKGEVTQIH